jgi:hypothetical protein
MAEMEKQTSLKVAGNCLKLTPRFLEANNIHAVSTRCVEEFSDFLENLFELKSDWRSCGFSD